MKTKQNEYAVIGLIIGAVLGMIVGLGAMNMIKESQRGQMLYPALGICILGFGVIGYSAGKSLGRETDKEIELGHDKAKENIFQQGRVWVAITEWSSKDNQNYKLITGQTNDKILISQLNDELVMNHEIQSGSKANVGKFHKAARTYIFNQQKAQYK